jgi:hypothetical protein
VSDPPQANADQIASLARALRDALAEIDPGDESFQGLLKYRVVEIGFDPLPPAPLEVQQPGIQYVGRPAYVAPRFQLPANVADASFDQPQEMCRPGPGRRMPSCVCNRCHDGRPSQQGIVSVRPVGGMNRVQNEGRVNERHISVKGCEDRGQDVPEGRTQLEIAQHVIFEQS